MNDLAARIAALEQQNLALRRQNAWTRRVAIFAALMVGGAILTAAAEPLTTSAEVNTKRLVIKNDKGEVRGFFDAAEGHGRIWIYDENNKTRTFLGPKGLSVDDEAGKQVGHVP